MTASNDKIPFAIEINRVIELLAAQIYPTPFALLRENVQNSFDAILIRKHLGETFDPCIIILIEAKQIQVSDNGIGMSRKDLENHFWRAGSSSKNTKEAREAGVVGTFGIGAMANFGIAEELIVETESAKTGERTLCSASKTSLSVTQDCIFVKELETKGEPGTKITATIQSQKSIVIKEAEAYIFPFVSFLPIDVWVNGKMVSRHPIRESVSQLISTWRVTQKNADLGEGITANIEISGAVNGEVRIELENILYGTQKLEGLMILRQGYNTLKTFRSGFGLATTGVTSTYQLGGVADFLFLQPTAGREALTTDSLSVLQKIVTQVEERISVALSNRPESNANAFFVAWVAKRKRYDLCTYLRVRVEPGDSMPLIDIRGNENNSAMLVYSGTDQATIKHASEDRPILVISRGAPRSECELGYLRKYCKIEELSNEQKVLKPKSDSDTSPAEKALSFRVAYVLSTDYFLDTQIKYGTISHGLPILVTNKNNPVEIHLDPEGSTVRIILELYEREYSAFGHMVKDFVRNMIFPKVADLVPSATKQGSEAFIKMINRAREIFEYDVQDEESLAELWNKFLKKEATYKEVTEKANAAVRSFQIVDSTVSARVRDVVPDVIDNERITEQKEETHFEAQPAIQRFDVVTPKKILTIGESEPPLKGYRCFLALTDRVKEEKGDFFLHPHRTSVVWGGQKALFIFEHHSGNYGLYYDLQTQSLISDDSGGGTFQSCTIIMKNRVFIPIPIAIQKSFLPNHNEKKRFEVKCDILYIDK